MAVSGSIPANMRAVFIDKQGGSLITKEVPIPVPGTGEVLVKIAAAPINPSDVIRLKNAHKDYDLNIFIPGLEGSGTVVAAGKGLLPKLWLGKRVACSSGSDTGGTWAEYMVTPATKCFPLNNRVSNEQGSMSLVNPLTALAFFDIARKNKHKAIINNAAASALGRMVEMLGDKKKIPVINIVRNPKQVELLKSTCSEFVLDSSDASFLNDLGNLSKNLNATILFDSVCSRELPNMIDVLPASSSVVIYGNLSGEEHILINPRTLIANNINISSFFLGNKAKENGIVKNMLNLREVGKLMSTDLKIKIQERYPLEKAQKALDAYLKNMTGGKVLLVMA